MEQVAGDDRAGRGRAEGRQMAGLEERKTKQVSQGKQCQSKQESKIFSCNYHKFEGPGALPRGMKQRTGDEWRETPALNCCRCEGQGTKLMSSRCAEDGGCSRKQKAPPSPREKENMHTESIGELDPENQSGFRTNHGIETAPLKMLNNIRCNLDNHKLKVLVLLDLTVTFDIVDHIFKTD